MRWAVGKSAPLLSLKAPSDTQALLCFGKRGWRADVHPHAVHAHAKGATGGDRPVPHPVEREGALGGVVKEPWMGDRHAGERKRHDLLFEASAADAPIGCQRKIATPVIAMARGNCRQH